MSEKLYGRGHLMIIAAVRYCLAHATDHEPRFGKGAPNWCEKYRDCLRHQAISRTPFDGSGTVANLPDRFWGSLLDPYRLYEGA